jgi:hypothetical protein
MLVSHRYKFIFLKTRKTASTSVEYYFEPFCLGPEEDSPGDQALPYESSHGIIGKRGNRYVEERTWQFQYSYPFVRALRQKKMAKWHNHMSARKVRRQVETEVWESYLKFATIRNPFTKVISSYFFKKSKARIPVGTPEEERMAFRHWILDGKFPVDRRIYCIGEDYILDEVIRYENLEQEMARICRKLQIPWDSKRLGNSKGGIRPDWAIPAFLFDSETQGIVEREYAFEIHKFGYRFPG